MKNTEPKVGRYLLGLLLITGVLVSCGGGAGSAMKPAGSTDAAQLAVSPSSLDFGSVLVGDSRSLPGSLTASNASVTVSSAAWSGEGYAVSGITFPTVVPAGQTVSFTVTFAPQAAGTSAGSINFVTSASNSPQAETFSGYGSQSSTHSVNLSWSPSSSPVVGYNVYRGTQNGGPYPLKLTRSAQPNTSYDDVTVQSGMTYYYVATAVNSDRTESSYSNQTTAAIP